jgi:hypothetical protein
MNKEANIFQDTTGKILYIFILLFYGLTIHFFYYFECTREAQTCSDQNQKSKMYQPDDKTCSRNEEEIKETFKNNKFKFKCIKFLKFNINQRSRVRRGRENIRGLLHFK